MRTAEEVAIAAIIGFIAGLGHGIVSHYVDLPLSLPEQINDIHYLHRALPMP